MFQTLKLLPVIARDLELESLQPSTPNPKLKSLNLNSELQN